MSQNIPPRWHIGNMLYDAYTVNQAVSVPVHWHSHFLLNLVTKGRGKQNINNKLYPLQEGSIIILSPLDFHQNIIDSGDMSIYAIKFSDKVFYDLISNLCAFDDFPIVADLNSDDFKTAKSLFSMLLKESEHKDLLGSDNFATSIIQQLTILALRACNHESKPTNNSPIRKALAFIQYNFRQDIKVSDIAKHIGYSENYFSKKFKFETGMEFQKYLLDLRLDFALKLLKFSDLTVTEVCFESGFNTLQHFSQAFKNKFGISAKLYKSKSRNQ